MAEQSLKEFYDSLIGASTNWHKIEHNWPAIACVFAFAVSGLYTFSGAVAGSFGHNILWLVIGSVTDPTALILIMSVLTEEICLQMPCVATFTKPAFDPRFPTIKRKMAANRAQIPTLTPEDLTDIDAARIGLKGSPTRVKKSFVPVRKSGAVVVSALPHECDHEFVVGCLARYLGRSDMPRLDVPMKLL